MVGRSWGEACQTGHTWACRQMVRAERGDAKPCPAICLSTVRKLLEGARAPSRLRPERVQAERVPAWSQTRCWANCFLTSSWLENKRRATWMSYWPLAGNRSLSFAWGFACFVWYLCVCIWTIKIWGVHRIFMVFIGELFCEKLITILENMGWILKLHKKQTSKQNS